MNMTQNNFIDTFIPSKDTRKYLKKIQYQFSEAEQATIIANHWGLTREKKVYYLQKILENTSDINLKKRLDEEIADLKKKLKKDHPWNWPESNGALYSFFAIPHDFRHGDIVRIVKERTGAGFEETIGVILGYDEKSYEFYKKLEGDYSDVQVCVDTRFQGQEYLGEFSHEHVNPIYIERVELSETDMRLGYLHYIIQNYEMLYGKGMEKSSLKMKSREPNSGRTPERIPAIMKTLQEVWRENPDLRLGQILSIAGESMDIFYKEDMQIMDGLWKNFLAASREKWKESYKGQYLPVYDERYETWVVDTDHGVEWGDLTYVLDAFCQDSVLYNYNDKHHKVGECADHVHGSFEELLLMVLRDPEHFDVEQFKDQYSRQELRVIYNLKSTLTFVKKENRPVTLEEGRKRRKYWEEQVAKEIADENILYE